MILLITRTVFYDHLHSVHAHFKQEIDMTWHTIPVDVVEMAVFYLPLVLR